MSSDNSEGEAVPQTAAQLVDAERARASADRGSHRVMPELLTIHEIPEVQVVKRILRALVPQMGSQWGAVLPIVLLDRIQQQTVVHTAGMPAPQEVEELLEAQTRVEAEVQLYSQRSKLMCRREGVEGRGLGDAKLQMDRKTDKLRFMMREEKSLQPVAYFYAVSRAPYCQLYQPPDCVKSWTWLPDCSDGETKCQGKKHPQNEN